MPIWKEKWGHILFFGKNYYDFLNDNKSQDFLVNFRKIPSYTKSHCLSYTDLYNLDKLKKFNNLYPKKLTYIKWIYKEHYKKWSDKIDKLMSQYKYHAYIDIDNYYNDIYTHFLYGVEVKDIKTFEEYMENYNKEEWLKDNTTESVHDFFKSFESHMNYKLQSSGIGIGNGISDFIAELYNKMIDFFVTSNSNLKEIEILRFRDDIYIFGNNKNNVNRLYDCYDKTLNKVNLHINTGKSHWAKKWTKREKKIKYVEDDFRHKLLKNKTELWSVKALKFCNKYPKSNKIFVLLQQIRKDEKITNKTIKNLANIFKKSKTNVMTHIISIIDTHSELYSDFLKQIKNKSLTDLDYVWIYCFEKKHKLTSKLSNKCLKTIKKFKLETYFDPTNIDFVKDSDGWNYG